MIPAPIPPIPPFFWSSLSPAEAREIPPMIIQSNPMINKQMALPDSVHPKVPPSP